MDERDTLEQDIGRWHAEGGGMARRERTLDPALIRVPRASRVRQALRLSRKVGVAVVGGSLLLLGVALIFLPGPAIIVIPLGLAVLGTEFQWAGRLLHQVRERAARAVQRARRVVAGATRPGTTGT
jgi:hypothetical protein